MKILRSKTIRGYTVEFNEYDVPENKFWRVTVKHEDGSTSAPFDNYTLALSAYIRRVNSLSAFG